MLGPGAAAGLADGSVWAGSREGRAGRIPPATLSGSDKLTSKAKQKPQQQKANKETMAMEPSTNRVTESGCAVRVHWKPELDVGRKERPQADGQWPWQQPGPNRSRTRSGPKSGHCQPPVFWGSFSLTSTPNTCFLLGHLFGKEAHSPKPYREPGPRPIPTGGNVAGRPRPWLEGPLNRGPGHDYPVFRGRGNGFELLSN